jgi:hypothetical protein
MPTTSGPGTGTRRRDRGPHNSADLKSLPPPSPQKLAYWIDEFCMLHGFSRAQYYVLRRAGLGPVEMCVGSRRLISVEAAAAWRRERENPS